MVLPLVQHQRAAVIANMALNEILPGVNFFTYMRRMHSTNAGEYNE